ncbi:uncharacterized protein LOC132217659 isoform X1 [Myotis daubentonii]|uniref:uncharacterized protein LOC132217659 isoform X1 n=1 Tax=Myotis daubentonii TaxID=98922 RepID=UPI0028735FD8|nr:uncharacterized protein LOC132217659 isoform X1 [Myotis daubentonii]
MRASETQQEQLQLRPAAASAAPGPNPSPSQPRGPSTLLSGSHRGLPGQPQQVPRLLFWLQRAQVERLAFESRSSRHRAPTRGRFCPGSTDVLPPDPPRRVALRTGGDNGREEFCESLEFLIQQPLVEPWGRGAGPHRLSLNPHLACSASKAAAFSRWFCPHNCCHFPSGCSKPPRGGLAGSREQFVRLILAPGTSPEVRAGFKTDSSCFNVRRSFVFFREMPLLIYPPQSPLFM